MKRSRWLALLIGLVLLLPSISAASRETYKGYPVATVMMDGMAIRGDVPAVILDGRTLLPARVLAEALGNDIAWDQETFTATLTSRPRLDTLRTADGLRVNLVGIEPVASEDAADPMAGKLQLQVELHNQSQADMQVDLNQIQLAESGGGADGTAKRTFVIPHVLEKSSPKLAESRLSLAPGERATVTLAYDLAGADGRSTASYGVVLNGGGDGDPPAMRLSITITIDCRQRPCSITITIRF